MFSFELLLATLVFGRAAARRQTSLPYLALPRLRQTRAAAPKWGLSLFRPPGLADRIPSAQVIAWLQAWLGQPLTSEH